MPQKSSTRGYIPLPTSTDSTPLHDYIKCLFTCQVLYLSAMSPNVLVMITQKGKSCHLKLVIYFGYPKTLDSRFKVMYIELRK